MTTESVATTQDHEFFRFSATYSILQNSTIESLASDAACFLESADAMINSLLDGGLSDPKEAHSMMFGIRHFVEMSMNICVAIQDCVPSTENAIDLHRRTLVDATKEAAL